MSKFKHSKLRNTGLLFEFLLRQVTVDVLNKKKESPALKIIKKQFNEHTELGKDLMNRIIEDTKEVGKIETHPKFEGRQMIMIIQPV